MPLTSPDNIFYADGSTPLSVESISAAEATSVQEALTNSRAIRSYKWVDQDAQDDQIDMQAGDEGYRIDTDTPYRYNGTDWVPIRVGLNLISPTSVSGATVNSAGKVSFSATASIVIDGVFSSLFDDYMITFKAPVTTSSPNPVFQFRAGGSVASGASYDNLNTNSVGGTSTVTVSQALAGTSWIVGALASAIHRFELKLSDPFKASPTIGFLDTLSITNPMTGGSTSTMVKRGFLHRLSTSYDGFQIVSVGTMTGDLCVYGVYSG